MRLPLGFSPVNAFKEATTKIPGSPTRGRDYNVFSEISVAGGDRSPVGGGLVGRDPTFNPAPIPTETFEPLETLTPVGGGGGGVDPQVAAYNAMRARQASEAQAIRNRLLGRESEVDSILNEILAAIDLTLGDTRKRRAERFDADTAALLESLNAATPEVEKAFASLGLSNSTFVGDRLKGVRDEWQKSQDDAARQYEDDLAGYSATAEANRSDARGTASKAKNSLNYVRNLEADADNLGRLAESEKTFSDMITDFSGQKSRFGSQGDFLKALEGIGSDYDFGKTLAAFGDFAGSASSISNPSRAANVAENIKGVGDKVKKKLTEVQVNNPIGAATA